MKLKPAEQLTLYRQLTKSQNLAEVQMSYKAKVKSSEREKITSSRDSYDILKDLFNEDQIEYIEQFIILLLNRGNKVLGWVKVSQGGITGTVADPRIIFQSALLANATSLILSHNHPSGNTAPSSQDIELTRKIREGGRILEISVLDHLIVTVNGYYSFADEGLLI
jgi:DNA repair protein RadC